MEIDCDKFIREITRRTKENYEFIKRSQNLTSNKKHVSKSKTAGNNLLELEKKESQELYEVTQLINSMYCMVVVPNEVFGIKHVKNVDDESALKTRFGAREKNLKKHAPYHELLGIIKELLDDHRMKYLTQDHFTQDSPVCAFIYSLRNALCHDGIGFFPISTDEGGRNRTQITDVIFETTSMNSDKVTFIARIKVEKLEEILFTIADLYSCIEKGKANAMPDEYIEFFTKLQRDSIDLL